MDKKNSPRILQAHPKLCQRACKANAREKEILKNAPPHDKRQ
jgi:hypothetical protein